MEQSFFELVSGRSGHFELESGHHSELWLDLDTLFAIPARVQPLIERLAALLGPHDAVVICGPLVGGAFLAQTVAAALNCEFAYTERHMPTDSKGLYPAQYRLPKAFVEQVRSRRIAIVDDVMSAGSAAMATYRELQQHGASTVVVGALMVLGTRGADLFAQAGVPVEAVGRREFQVWLPEDCPLCARGAPLVRPG